MLVDARIWTVSRRYLYRVLLECVNSMLLIMI